ncbi:MAG: hypothetical protein ABSF83_04130 [Nitrososphaerales archaeon]
MGLDVEELVLDWTEALEVDSEEVVVGADVVVVEVVLDDWDGTEEDVVVDVWSVADEVRVDWMEEVEVDLVWVVELDTNVVMDWTDGTDWREELVVD